MDRKQIYSKIDQLFPQVREWRRTLHQNPELGFQEQFTGDFVAEILTNLGIEVRRGLAQTGVIGLLRTGKSGPVVALRADMDALPIQEETGFEYASGSADCMHACGHDVHTAIVLGVARVLKEVQDCLVGDVVFIFQPAEECHPGGAKGIVDSGLFQELNIRGVFGLHTEPYHPVGTIAVRSGPMMAAADMFDLVIRGQGGHGAAPHQTIDPIVTSAQVITALQTIASRNVSPTEPVVVTVGTIHGGQVGNVIPEEVQITGTVRSFDHDLRGKLPELLDRIIGGVCQANGAAYRLNYQLGYPPVINHPKATELVKRSAVKVLGLQSVIELSRPCMGGEDFAYYLDQAEGCFFFLGGQPEGQIYPWHHPKYAINEDAIPEGMKVLVETVLSFQEGG